LQYEIYDSDLPDNLTLVGDIAIDTETMGLNFALRDRLCLLQMADQSGKVFLIQFNRIKGYKESKNLVKLLSDNTRQKIFHFARFDLAVIKRYLDVTVQNVFCTKIASIIARTYTQYHGLKELCRELLGVQLNKQMQSSNWGKSRLDPEQIKYAIDDVKYLHKLREGLISSLRQENKLEVALNAIKCLDVIVDLDLLGYGNVFSHSYVENN
jgi:ribonuclease D